jgi:RHS repeat-associated protein
MKSLNNIMKKAGLLMALILLGGYQLYAQAIGGTLALTSGTANTCGVPATGTLTLSGYSSASTLTWEVVEWHNGAWALAYAIDNTGPTYTFSQSSGDASYRVKVKKLLSVAYSNVFTITSFPPPVAGTINGGGNFYLSASGTLTLQGSYGTIVRWEQTQNGVTTNIANTSTTQSFNVTTTTTYRALIGNGPCTQVYSQPVTVRVFKEGNLSGPTSVVEGSTALLELNNYDGPILRWESSTDNGSTWANVPITESTFSPKILVATKYRVVFDFGAFGQKYSNEWNVTPTSYSLGNPVTGVAGQNYIRQQSVAVAGVKTAAEVDALSSTSKHESLSYLDGHSREVQRVLKKTSPLASDIVTMAEYDSRGDNGTKKYLPYVSGNTGAYHAAAVTEQTAFYTNGTADKITDSPYPFARSVVESSPLARVVEAGAPGQEWQPGSGHTNRYSYQANDASNVRQFSADGSSTSFYAANELLKTEITNENGAIQQIFVDKFGRVILKREQLDDVINGSTVPWLETYYIYNTNNQLKYVISPKGVAALKTGSWTNFATIKDNYVFQYVYDAKGRVIETKTPGQAWSYYVFDPLDRLVLYQDGNVRASNKWFFIKYDQSQRQVMQGLYLNATQTTRAAVQTLLDGLYTQGNATYGVNTWYEYSGTTLHGYSNQSFPKLNANNTALEVYIVNYYDHHDFDGNGTADFLYTPQGFANEATQGSSRGLPTGAKKLILGTSNWLYQYVFYDITGKTIQERTNNHLSLTVDNLVTVAYDFEGKVLSRKSYHNAGAGKVTTVLNQYLYDLAGRVTEIYQTNNTSASQLIAKYEYNELGQMIDRKLHDRGGSDFVQSIDYRHSIRGWLTSINNADLSSNTLNDDAANAPDYFGMEYVYQNIDAGLSNTPQYNGAISALKWKGPGMDNLGSIGIDKRSYVFVYDKTNKLKSATYKAYNGTTWSKELNALNESLTYDQNGNILSLQRNQRKLNTGLTPTFTSEVIDNLTYTYNTTIGDRLTKIEDASANPAGFLNGTNLTTEFTYDVQGNVTVDQNRKISSMTYNAFGRVQQIVFVNGNRVDYGYDGSGNKLWTKINNSVTTDYVQEFVYEAGVLNYFAMPEGRVANVGGALQYQYMIKDHLGNVRVLFSSVSQTTPALVATFEGDSNDASSQFTVDPAMIVSSFAANSTVGGSKVVRMNQTYKIGPSKSLAVFPGDKVDLEVMEYHEAGSGYGTSSTPQAMMINLIAAAFGGVPGGTGVSGEIYNGVNTAVTTYVPSGNQGDSRPAAYLNYILFDRNYKVIDMGWQLAPATTFTKQKIQFSTLKIKEAGFLFTYLSYDDESNNWVFFDDFKVTHTKTNVLQYNEYYPFGLKTNSSWTRENSKNNILYNDASELNELTSFYDLAFRNYDPTIGRFLQVDPLAIMTESFSPYQYSRNNPISYNDPLGLQDNVMVQEAMRRVGWDEYGTSGGGGGSGYYTPSYGNNEIGDGPVVYNPWEGSYISAYEVLSTDPTYQNAQYRQDAQVAAWEAIFAYQENQQAGPDPSTSLFELYLRMAVHMPNAISFGGNVEAVPGIGGGVYERGKIYVLDGNGSQSQYHDVGVALFGIDGGVNAVITEYYYVNLSGNPYDFTIKDHEGNRLSAGLDVNFYGVLSVGVGFSIAPVEGVGSNMFILSRTVSVGIGIEGSPVSGNVNVGETKLIKK